jgi:uncharacterized protein with FMN-binding domain
VRRSLAALAGTIAGLAGLLSYKSGPPPRAGAAATVAGGTANDPTSSPPTTVAPRAASSPTPSTTTVPVERRVTGADVPNRFGDVQVQAVFVGNKLVDVLPVVLPSDRPRSQRISDAAAPILRQEALAAQGARIQLVSGATYTSEGYAQSLQSALDQARR